MKNILIRLPLFFLVFGFCLSLAGCTTKEKPKDLPELFPCEITIIQDGKPLEGASVFLSAEGTSVRFTVAGKTDASGIAKIKTDIDWDGAPAGTYKVTVKKLNIPKTESTEVPNDPAAQAEFKKKLAEASKNVASTVDEKFLHTNTTPLKIEVKAGGVKESFDVGAASNKLWSDSSKGTSDNH